VKIETVQPGNATREGIPSPAPARAPGSIPPRSPLRNLAVAVGLLLAWTTATAAGLADVTSRDAAAGLREALVRGSQIAVQRLGVENGFFTDEKVKIPLPDSLKKVEGLMRSVGMGRQADELVLRMNRAAEAAVPQARALLVEAVKKMTLEDAKGILTGGDDGATQYFRRATAEPLAQRFQPIVKKAMEKVRLAEKYNEFAETGARFGLVKNEDAKLENYITRRALDGLYLVIAEEERKIRRDPVGEASGIIRRVFGAIGK